MDVVVVGSCNTDLISYASRLPKKGETLKGYKFSIGFGGKGANQCVMAAKLGAIVAMIGKLGNDTFGKDYLENFHSHKVNLDHLKVVEGVSSGVAPINVGDNGENCIIIVPGANDLMTSKEVETAEDMIKNAKVLICQNEIPQEVSLTAARLAGKHNVPMIYNPAPAPTDLHPQLFSIPDFFCPNETEAELLTGMIVSSVEEAMEACKVLQDTKDCKTVIITLGKKGAVYKEKSGNAVHVSIKEVKAIDTTGAGDSFIGSLAYFVAKMPNLDLKEKIERACQIASVSVLSPGTQCSFPTARLLPEALLRC